MSDLDKINIYVPDETGKVLINDALHFEVFKKDMQTVNWNRFLSMLLLGYYNLYIDECQRLSDNITKSLQRAGLSAIKCRQTSEEIIKQIHLPDLLSRRGKNPAHFSLKPTNATEGLIQNILLNIREDSISQYFCRMLTSYTRKSFSERERLVFNEIYHSLLSACHKRHPVSFSTIWNPDNIHQVIPYKVTVGLEERYNYLLCAETDAESGKQIAKSYRLNRISKLHFIRKDITLEDDTIRHLESMSKLGPQYMINEDEETCVKITGDGQVAFQRMYNGRPVYDRIVKEGSDVYYFFKGSQEQILSYFKRFNAKEAEIISPPALREKMAAFHRDCIAIYG